MNQTVSIFYMFLLKEGFVSEPLNKVAIIGLSAGKVKDTHRQGHKLKISPDLTIPDQTRPDKDRQDQTRPLDTTPFEDFISNFSGLS